MIIELNGEDFDLEDEISIDKFIEDELDLQDTSSLVIVINDRVIKKSDWSSTIITAGSVVEVINFVEGG